MEDFTIENRIYYHDTDSGGVVYYARYLEHLEEGRSEFFRNRGIDLADYGRKGVLFPVVHLEVDYKCPAKYGDVVKITSRLEKTGKCSLRFYQEIRRDQTVLIAANTIWACVNSNMKPMAIPGEMLAKLEAR